MEIANLPQETDLLKKVEVRLLRDDERERFDQLLCERHYLHSACLVGQGLRYVAEFQGQWVALLTFSAAALHLKAREQWIGWTPRQRARRLPLIVNNSRFLVLPERERWPNLASRVLGLCLRRLSQDWEVRWQHPVLLVESFVDESRYRGTCYRACGFEALGLTKGSGRDQRDFYTHHGQPKQLYVRALHPKAAAWLGRGCLPKALEGFELNTAGPCPLRAAELDSLFQRFRQLKDQRQGHGLRHRQEFVLACAAVAVLMGAGGYRAMEDICLKLTQRQLRALGAQPDENRRYHAPSDSTFRRVVMKLDASMFERLIGAWLLEQELSVVQHLAVDGKVLRGSGRADGKALQLLSVVTHRLSLTLGQVPIQEKSNEIPALEPLLRSLHLSEKVVITADALHCQQKSAGLITQELGSDYIFGLKGNQSGILERAQTRLKSGGFFPSGQ